MEVVTEIHLLSENRGRDLIEEVIDMSGFDGFHLMSQSRPSQSVLSKSLATDGEFVELVQEFQERELVHPAMLNPAYVSFRGMKRNKCSESSSIEYCCEVACRSVF